MGPQKTWSKRELAEFIADNGGTGGSSEPGVLTLGPYPSTQRLGILAPTNLTLSNYQIKSIYSSDVTNSVVTFYLNNDSSVYSTSSDTITLTKGDLFEVRVVCQTPNGLFDGGVYISFLVQ